MPFSKLNVLPTHAKAITRWEDQDEAFAIVAQRIRETVDQLNAQKLAEEQRWQQFLAQQEAERQLEQEQLKQNLEDISDERRRSLEALYSRKIEDGNLTTLYALQIVLPVTPVSVGSEIEVRLQLSLFENSDSDACLLEISRIDSISSEINIFRTYAEGKGQGAPK